MTAMDTADYDVVDDIAAVFDGDELPELRAAYPLFVIARIRAGWPVRPDQVRDRIEADSGRELAARLDEFLAGFGPGR